MPQYEFYTVLKNCQRKVGARHYAFQEGEVVRWRSYPKTQDDWPDLAVADGDFEPHQVKVKVGGEPAVKTTKAQAPKPRKEKTLTRASAGRAPAKKSGRRSKK